MLKREWKRRWRTEEKRKREGGGCCSRARGTSEYFGRKSTLQTAPGGLAGLSKTGLQAAST